jgi:hypothetical protein
LCQLSTRSAQICRLLPFFASFRLWACLRACLRGTALYLYIMTYNHPAPRRPAHFALLPSLLSPTYLPSPISRPTSIHYWTTRVFQPFHEALSFYGPDGCALPPKTLAAGSNHSRAESDNLDARPLSWAAPYQLLSRFTNHVSSSLYLFSVLAVRSFSTTGESAQRLTLSEAHHSLTRPSGCNCLAVQYIHTYLSAVSLRAESVCRLPHPRDFDDFSCD